MRFESRSRRPTTSIFNDHLASAYSTSRLVPGLAIGTILLREICFRHLERFLGQQGEQNKRIPPAPNNYINRGILDW